MQSFQSWLGSHVLFYMNRNDYASYYVCIHVELTQAFAASIPRPLHQVYKNMLNYINKMSTYQRWHHLNGGVGFWELGEGGEGERKAPCMGLYLPIK